MEESAGGIGGGGGGSDNPFAKKKNVVPMNNTRCADVNLPFFVARVIIGCE